MARDLKRGEPVTVKSEVHMSSKSEAYKHGLKKIAKGDIGEVVGPAEGRALTVRFKGVDAVVSKQSLERPTGAPPQKAKPTAAKPAKAKPALAKPVATAQAATPSPEPASQANASPAQDIDDGGSQLLNAVANKLLLRGSTRVERESVVEVSLSELPADVRERLQALIDAKLAFNPRDLKK